MSDQIENLKLAAERTCGCHVDFEGFTPVVETFQGSVIWEGVVNQFTGLNGRVYAWAVQGEKETQYIAVNQKPPIKTPLDAVRAWIASQRRK